MEFNPNQIPKFEVLLERYGSALCTDDETLEIDQQTHYPVWREDDRVYVDQNQLNIMLTRKYLSECHTHRLNEDAFGSRPNSR